MLFVFVFSVFFCNVLSENDFLKFDYCTLNCENEQHSACDCSRRPPREEITTDPSLINFRKHILNQHNYWRNYVAEGRETRPNKETQYCPKASNMMLMNYDMELEHISRCRAINSYQHTAEDKTGLDFCHNDMEDEQLGQNLAGIGVYNGTYMSRIDVWYAEIRHIGPTTIATLDTNNHKFGHFTQILWSNTNRLGCVRVYNPDNVEAWQYTLICHYGSDFGLAGNVPGQSVYREGEPCTECYGNTKCDKDGPYPFLCGELKLIPKDGVTASSPQMERGKKIFIAIVLIVFVLAY